MASTYDNMVMPLIRYRTMDMAVYSQKPCACGKNYQVLSRIEGRLQEMLITPSGRKISMTAINMHDRIFDHVKQFQFYQDSPEYCVFNVVRGEQYDKADEEDIYKGLMKKLGDLKLRIQYVDEIPRTKSGKYRFLVQKLEI